jgi:tetratricopeptide (TPR) repeat protein
LWLLAILLVPLVFFGREYAKSEAVIGYVEVPKVALLRLLTGAMAVLWLVQWGIRGRLPSGGIAGLQASALNPLVWRSSLAGYVKGDPHLWVILAVGFYLVTTLVSTVLSGSFIVSMWGEVPGQDGYSAYTIISYVVLFGVLATHLKTRAQLWRILAAIAVMAVVVGGYVVLQHNGHDFLNMAEETGGRTTAFMGNTIFAGAALMMTIPITLAAAVVSLLALPNLGLLDLKRFSRYRLHLATLAVWVAALSVQSLGLIFTYSRGPWVGTITAMAVMLGLITLFAGKQAIARVVLLLGLTMAVVAFVILDPVLEFGGGEVSDKAPSFVMEPQTGTVGSASIPDGPASGESDESGIGVLDAASSVSVALDPSAANIVGRFGSIKGEVIGGFTGGRGTHWRVSWTLIRYHPWFEFETLSLRWLRPIIGYGPDLFRYTYLLKSPPDGPERYPLEPDHAHNYFIHQTVEQGFLGLISSLGVFAAVLVVGAHQAVRIRRSLTTAHLVILAGLLAVVIGRFLEMMVGIARVSDLTILWTLLGVFAALPTVMRPTQEPTARPAASRRARLRNRSQNNQDSWVQDFDWRWAWRLALVAWLAGGIVMLTWFKAVNYPLAAVKAGEAIAHLRNSDLASTLAGLDAAIALAPDVPTYHEWRARAYLAYAASGVEPSGTQCGLQKQDTYESCLAHLAYQSSLIGAAKSPYYYRSRFFVANSAANLGLEDEAARHYRGTSALVPGSWVVRNALANSYIKQGQTENALESLGESLAITEDTYLSGVALSLQGQVYQAAGESQKWVESYKRSLTLSPTGRGAGNANYQLALFYINEGDREKALNHLSSNVRGNPTNPNVFAARGKAQLVFEQYELSLDDYEEALRLNASQAEIGNLGENLAKVFLSRGESLSNQGRYWPAIGEFSRAIRADSEYSLAYRERGNAHKELGLVRRARQDFEIAVRLDPGDENARAYLDATNR